MVKWILVGIFAMGMVGCSDDAAPGVVRNTYTKAQAESLGGETSDGKDICQLMNWYTDGVCDRFCVQRDDECSDGTCSGNIDCQNGQECDNGQCVAIVPACSATLTCPTGLYCEYGATQGCGTDGQRGLCLGTPETCTEDEQPVCGCDAITYTNACEAARAGVSVASEGACVTGPQTCNTNLECPENSYCYLAVADQCSAEAEGTCQEIPELCNRDLMPVCGCDGTTYTNACEAARASVNVAAEGACLPEGACGGRVGDTCEDTEYCLYEDNAECGRTDLTGHCTILPEACPKNYLPVCGCDGKTYGNSCLAALQKVSVDYEGACACQTEMDCEEGETCTDGFCANAPIACGARAGDTCSATQWCDFGGTTGMCGQTDLTGTCEARPTACADQIAPVCGCDGNTYNNACEAHRAGVDILDTRACRIPI